MSIFHFLFVQNYEYLQNCSMLDSVTFLNLLYCLTATRGGTLEQGGEVDFGRDLKPFTPRFFLEIHCYSRTAEFSTKYYHGMAATPYEQGQQLLPLIQCWAASYAKCCPKIEW